MRDILPALPRSRESMTPGLAAALAWKLAAGPELASRAEVRECRAGVLLLHAADAAARAQIEAVTPELVRALKRMLPADGPGPACRRIQFVP